MQAPPHLQTQRFFLDVEGNDAEALREGFAWLVRESQAHGAIYVPQLSNASGLATGLGDARTRALIRDRRVVVAGKTIELSTDRSRAGGRHPLLAVWPTDDGLDRLDNEARPAICVIPWNRDETAYWVLGRQPIDLRTGRQAGAGPTGLGPLVTVALSSLPTWGVTDSRDRARAAQALVLLRGEGEVFDATQVRVLALRCGWRATDAAALAELAGRINAGARPRLSRRGFGLREDIVDVWRAKVAAEGSG